MTVMVTPSPADFCCPEMSILFTGPLSAFSDASVVGNSTNTGPMLCVCVTLLCKSVEACLGACVVVTVVVSLDDVAFSVDTTIDVSVVAVASVVVITLIVVAVDSSVGMVTSVDAAVLSIVVVGFVNVVVFMDRTVVASLGVDVEIFVVVDADIFVLVVVSGMNVET